MRIWHATWDLTGKLFLWGEAATRFDTPGERPTDGSVHPFAIPHAELKAELEPLEIDYGESSLAELLIPTANGLPIPSSGLLISTEIDNTVPIEVGFWKVAAEAFNPLDTVVLLTSLPPETTPGIRYGGALRFWVEATKYLLELLCHGRFLPTLRSEVEYHRARWQLVITGKDHEEKFQKLVNAMPPVAVCTARNGNSRPDNFALLESFLADTGDALIRSFLVRDPLISEEDCESAVPRMKVPARFIQALTARDATLVGSLPEILKLETRLQHWAQPLVGKRKRGELSISFQLKEPVEPEKRAAWNVDFLVGLETDPKHSITMRSIFAGEFGFLRHANVTFEEIEEKFLRELGRAVQTVPAIKRCLSEQYPTSVSLTTQEAYLLLREQSQLLEENGIRVIVPDWWERAEHRLGLRLKLHSGENSPFGTGTREPAIGMNALFDYSWKVALGDGELSEVQFEKLLTTTEPLVYINGVWVEVPRSKLEATNRLLKVQKSGQQLQLRDLLRMGLGFSDDDSILPVVGYSASGWISQLLDNSRRFASECVQPDGFLGELRPYQLQGLSWFAFLSDIGLGGCLADDMGLGKTIQLLALLLHERQKLAASQAEMRERGETIVDDRVIGPTLLVVPMSILGNWETEAVRFTPALKVHIHHGPMRLTGNAFIEKASSCDVVLTTYSITHRDEELLKKVRWERIALDEAQNIKNLNTKTTKAIRRLAFLQLQDTTQRPAQRLALTGTPLENHLDELWSIFDFLNPGYLGDLPEFRRRFSIPIERYRRKESSDTLSAMVRPFILRRLKSDPNVISDLPEKIEIEELLTLLPEQAALYQRILDEMLPQVDTAAGMHRKGLVLSTITKLKQVCDSPALYFKDFSSTALSLHRSGKVRRLEELLEVILAEDDKVLIFSQFAQMGEILKPYLEERFSQEVLFLHGRLNRPTRDGIVAKFQSKTGPRIFLLSLKAGGYGLNLTEANQVIHFDQWWNPAVQDQATDRAYRIGQKRNVQVRKFICRGTLEERINEITRGKRALADNIVGSTKNILTEMSTDELRKLLSLSFDDTIEESGEFDFEEDLESEKSGGLL